MKWITDRGPVDLEGPGYLQLIVINMIKIGKYDHLAFTITKETGFTNLGVFTRRDMRVFMIDNQVMQNNLGGHAEGKDHQHKSTQKGPYGRYLNQIS